MIFKNFIFIFFRENLFRLPFYYCLFIIPIILLISFKKIYILLRKNLIVIFPIFLLIMLPIFYGSLFNFNIDSGGIMYFPKAIAITCFILYFVSKVEKNKMGFLIGTFILQASFIFFDNINPNSLKMDHPKISKEFISQIDKKINSGDWGVVIKNMDNAVVWDYNPYTLRKFHFIQLLNKQIGIINISDMNMKEGLGLSKSLISQGEFESYKPVEKVNGDFYKKQLDFIKQKNINFIITDELQMKNPYIKPIIIDSLIDKLTKYKIYFLK
ncbi:MAG: hypothetical protein KGZ59_11115 [Chitinophagaceae bacterium]|nr:hypothetical protein [Chitinophagaceae bacterium]